MSRRAHNARSDPDPAASAGVFAALGDQTRLQLVSRLCREGPLSIARLTDGFPMTRQAITKHLRLMQNAGLVTSTTKGRESLWQVETKRIAEAQRQLQLISARWDRTLSRLKNYVERSARGERHDRP